MARNPSGLVTAVTVNFKTPSLIAECIDSFAACYGGVRHIVVDNGGCEESVKVLKARNVRLVENAHNVGHGIALCRAFAMVGTSYAFTLDSDTRVEKCGFLEKMLAMFKADDHLFAIGWLRYVGNTGVAYLKKEQKAKKGHPYIHPFAALFDVAKYRTLRPFNNSGGPAFALMKHAVREDYALEDFPVQDYVWHKVAGTRGMFGGRWRVPTDAKPGEWRRRAI